MNSNRFICAINRNRDGYQVPLALHEAGMLERFVTDFYAPDEPRPWLTAALQRRRHVALPAAMTANARASFIVQSAAQVVGIPMMRPFAFADRLLGAKAGRLAAATGTHLYCYHPHLPSETAIAPGTRRIVFAYHPPPSLSLDLLRADHAQWPQIAASFALEQDVLQRPQLTDYWRHADAVVCASGMTRRSLEHDGCPPEKITVIPYGITVMPECAPTPRYDTTEFLFVGQGVQRKGLHHLIAAWQASELAHARLTLVCYDMDPGIRAMIHSPSIRLFGRQSREQLNALYAQADVFVLPSLVEGFGLVYGEALAQGCHIVGTANTGLPDLHLSADVATLVRAGDPRDLIVSLSRLRDAAVSGMLDRSACRAAAADRGWARFRAAIAAHARSVIVG